MQLQNKIAGAPVAVQQRRSRVQNARQTHVRVQAAAATEVKLNTTKSDEVSNLQQHAGLETALHGPASSCSSTSKPPLTNCRS